MLILKINLSQRRKDFKSQCYKSRKVLRLERVELLNEICAFAIKK